MPSAITQTNGSAIRPRNATAEPLTPNQRLPRTTEALPIFGPGRNWQRPIVSAKSACVSQRRSSTIVRCAHGITPPNERAPMARNPVKSSLRLCGGVTSIFCRTIHHILAPLAALSLCIAAYAGDAHRARILAHGPWPQKVSTSNREAIALGERLFFDPALSGTGSILCATCHIPYKAFQDGKPRAFGLELTDRNTPTLVNVGFYRRFGWDGARDSLARQSIRPLLEPREMRSSPAHVAAAARKFGLRGSDEAVLAEVGKALAAFQETLVSARTPFDDFRDALLGSPHHVAEALGRDARRPPPFRRRLARRRAARLSGNSGRRGRALDRQRHQLLERRLRRRGSDADPDDPLRRTLRARCVDTARDAALSAHDGSRQRDPGHWTCWSFRLGQQRRAAITGRRY